MNDLQKVIEIGEYPAKCFKGSASHHRRSLRQLMNQGHIQFMDSEGAPHDRDAVMNGGIHFDNWYVTKQFAETIAQKIEEEAVILEEQERRVAERKRIEANSWPRTKNEGKNRLQN